MQRGVATESRINLKEIVPVIAMVGVRIKDRVEIDRVYPNGDEMWQAEANAVKITAVKIFRSPS